MNDTEKEIEQTLTSALLAGRLPPATPLREVALAGVFGVSRECIRKILQRLGARNLLQMVPNRGAFVAAPSLEQARNIYESRRVLESGIMATLALRLSSETQTVLRRHIDAEARALLRGDRAESVQLSAEFHLLLASATGSAWAVQQLQELVSRTSMLVAMYEPASLSRCSCEEHREMFTSLLSGDGERAVRSVCAHLSLVETRLRHSPAVHEVDPLEMLNTLWSNRQRRNRKAA